MRDEFKSYCRGGAYKSIVINEARELTPEQHLDALKRIRAYISGGGELKTDNSDMHGDKHTHATWGVCADKKEFWPTPELHIFPMDFTDRGRVEPLNPPPNQTCPMRAVKEESDKTLSGCFYQCRIFQRHKHTPTREEALALYDEVISTLEGECLK